MELNDPCRICIEENFEDTMVFLTGTIKGVFQVLASELGRLLQSETVTVPAEVQSLQQLFGQVLAIVGNEETPSMIIRASVEEFYAYYVARGLYGELGADFYVENYAAFMEAARFPCIIGLGDPGLCPATVTEDQARAALVAHADNTFSSVTTSGNPFPFWSEGDGTGVLFGGTNPVGGSGVPMAGQLLSLAAYLDASNYGDQANWNPLYSNGQYLDPLTPGQNWNALVTTDPVYNWFLAGVTPMTSRTCETEALLHSF